MQYLLLQTPDYFHTHIYCSNTTFWYNSQLSQVSPVSEKRHEMIIIAVQWAYLWGSQWKVLIEWKKCRGFNKTYTRKNLMLLRGLQPLLSSVPTGFLEEGMSSLLAKGPNLLPQCQQSLRADRNLGHPRARQGACNRTDTQSDVHTHRHIQAL